MPSSALPPGYKLGSDNQSWLMKVKKTCQIWLAAGPRVPSGFFKWRDLPLTVFAARGKGTWRLENTDGTDTDVEGCCKVKWLQTDPDFYLSRIQPWCRWHIALQWPLYLQFHWIYRQKNVVKYLTYQSEFGICKLLTLGIGFKRDSDKVYWVTCNLGGNFE